LDYKRTMLLLYFFIGIFAAVLGALPLGASNIAVINTTLKQNASQAFKIAITAGIAEVMLSLYALHCNTIVQNFINHNMWIQITIVVLLLVIGAFLFFKKQAQKQQKHRTLTESKYITGFFLGILNPPVLIYWIVAIGMINDNNYMLSLQSSLSVLFLFFFGIYLGKILTLYLYSRFSLLLKHRVQNISLIVNKVTGVFLIVIGLVQAIKLYAF
jgi:threonine/homoserine/homoserine lactone efflux protein